MANAGTTGRQEQWLLSLDMGTNSIGWAAFRLGTDDKPTRLLDGGVRLFDWGRQDDKKDSLNKLRGEARRARNRISAKVWRRKKLLGLLSRIAGIAADPARTDVWTLRARAVNEALAPAEVAACLMHMARHRGFKSLALVEQDPTALALRDEEAKRRNEELHKWDEAERQLRHDMTAAGVSTVAELFAGRLANGQPVRARRGEGAVPTRRLVREEFARLKSMQRHLGWRDEDWNAIEDTIFEQRPLTVPEKGRCTAFPEDRRMPKALPSAQRFLVRQTLCNLRVDLGVFETDRPLTEVEFDALAARLDAGVSETWSKLRGVIGLRGQKFTIERARAAGEKKTASKLATGDETAAAMVKLFPNWPTRPLSERDALVRRLLDIRRERRKLIAFGHELGLSDADSATLADIAQFALPRGYLAFGEPAVAKILPHMTAGTRAHEAIAKGIGRPHSERSTSERRSELPYYGAALPHRTLGGSNNPADDEETRYGRLGNVTVHIALNQARKIVNALIRRYGRPRRIVIETTRQLKANADQLRAIDREQRKNEDAHKEADKDFAEAYGGHASKAGVSRHERWRRHRLAKRQGLLCPYTGNTIGMADLATSAYWIDHIIPLTRGGTDADANVVVCKVGANSAKLNRTAWEAFHNTETWRHIEAFLDRLKKSDKRLFEAMAWRFGPRAAEEAKKDDGGWAPRQIVDTSYIARVAQEYLKLVADEVVATKGGVTAYVRAAWGPPKNRLDQRHHFVDAAVIGCTGRSVIQQINHLHARGALPGASESGLELPYENYAAEIERRYERVWPSLRPDRSVEQTTGAFHNDLLFGKSKAPDGMSWRRTRRYSPEELFKDGEKFRPDNDVEATIKSFVSLRFRERFRALLAARKAGAGAKTLAEQALDAARDTHWGPRGIGEIRCFVDKKGRDLSEFTTVPRGNHRAIVDTNANAWLELRRDAKGRWRGTAVSVLEAARRPHPLKAPSIGDAPALILQRKDLVAWEHEGKTVVGWVKVLKSNGDFYIWPLLFAEIYERLRDECAALGIQSRDGRFFRASSFATAKGRKVTVSLLGRLRDPGPPTK